MAQLHGRVRWVRHRALNVALAIGLAIGLPPSSAIAQTSRLEALETGLASDVASERAAAVATYASLGEADMPEVSERLHALGRRRADGDETTRVLATFRHAVGSRRADDLVDIAPGIAPTLDTARDRTTVRLAAVVLLERVAERVGTPDALRAVVELARWSGDGMRLEARRASIRMGARLAPAILAARSDETREARQWAEWSGARLGLEEPGRFVAGLDAALVPDVLRAFAAAHVMSAVPIVVSFVDSPRSSTRLAAREALVAYGQNSIWVAREAYRVRAGEPADSEWGWRRTLDALFAVVDAALDQRIEADLLRATTALDAGDRGEARAALNAVLASTPTPSTSAPARALLQLAELDLAADDDAAVRADIARAMRLPLEADERPRLDALRALLASDALLEGGVLDTDGYARAAVRDPSCETCAARHARFEEPATAQVARQPYRLWIAAAAFLVLALLLWPSRSPERPKTVSEEPVPEADATLPG